MRKDEVRSTDNALVYLVDCQLATVCRVVDRRSSSRSDIERHISIAQLGVDWVLRYGLSPVGTRIDEISRSFNGRVDLWAAKFKPALKQKV